MKIKGFLFKKARRTFSVAFFVVITFFFSFLIIPGDVLAKTIKIGSSTTDISQVIGKMGIGTDNPGATLQINPAASTEGLRIISSNYSPFVIRNSANTADLFRIDQSGNIVGGNAGSWTLNGSNLYPVSTSYNVGIGTTNPVAKLEINSAGAFNPSVPGTLPYGLHFASSATSGHGSGITWAGFDSRESQAGIYVNTSVGATNMYFATSDNFDPGAETKMTINSGGKVGIGTTNPLDKLHLGSGSLRISSLLNCSGTGQAVKTDSSGRLVCGSVSGGITGSGATSSVARWTSASTLGTGILYDNGTNVGVNITAPAGKLHVNNGVVIIDKDFGIRGDGYNVNARNYIWALSNAYPDRGISYYEGSVDYVSIHPGGLTNVLAIADNGRVGVGTTAPTKVLDVNGDSLIRNAATFSSSITASLLSGTASRLVSVDANGNFGAITAASSGQTLRFSGSAWVPTSNLFNNGSNIGIGTSSPATRLDIYGGHSDTRMRLYANTGQTGVNSNSILSFWASEPNMTYNGAGIGENINGSPYGGIINSERMGTLIRFVNGITTFERISTAGTRSESMRIDSSGNLGIGVSPSQKLQVAGNIYVNGSILAPEGTLRDDNGGWIRTYGSTGWYSQSHGGGWYMTDSSWIRNYGSKPLYINGNGTTAASFMSGNVGIGITNPATKLYVNGTLSVTGATTFSEPITIGAPILPTHAATKSYVDSVSIDLGAAPGLTLVSNGDYWVTSSNLFNNGTNVGIGTTAPGVKLDVTGAIRTNNQLISTVANGTAPLAVSSNTVVANLNADYLDGQHGAYYNHRVYNDAGNYLGAGYISGGAEKPNWTGFGAGKLKLQMLSGSNTGAPDNWNDVLWMSAYTGSDVKNSNALIFGKGATDRIGFVRQAYDATAWGTYREIYHTGNSNTSGVDWNARDLTVHGGDLIINSNNGGITFNDASAYWLKTATNWGIYWDTAANQIKFNGSGTTRSFIDLDDGAAYFNGNVGIGTTAPADKLHLGSGSLRISSLLNCSGTGQAIKTDSSGRLVCGSVSGGITGSGTTNYVARWTGASTLGKGVLYDNGTNVGIGTTAPTNKLTIVDTPLTGAPLNSSDTMDIVNNGTVSLNMIANTSGDINLLFSDTTRAMGEIKYKNSDNSLRFRTNGVADRMIINSAGNIGIGTTAPGSKLEISSPSLSYALPVLGTGKGSLHINPIGTNDTFSALTFGSNSGTIVNSGQAGIYVQGSGSYGTKMYFATTNSHATGAQSRMVIDAVGNVGINTTNPTTKLYVNGDTTNTGYLSITGAQNTSGNIRFSAGNPYISASSYIIIPGGIYVSGGTPYFANRIEARGGIHNDTASYLTVHGGTSGNTYFNGNVGIGITNPTTKLYVNGTLSVTGATTFSKPITIGEPTLPTHAATRSYVDSVSIDLGAAPGSTLRSNGDYWVANSNLYNNGTNVGIGTASPSVKLEVNGDVKGASFTYTSDISYKKDVETIENPIAKIQALRGVRFNWKKDNTPAIGLIAQEVEKVFPEVVIGEEGNKGVSYGALVAPLIEAVKAQQEQIDSLRERIELLEKKN